MREMETKIDRGRQSTERQRYTAKKRGKKKTDKQMRLRGVFMIFLEKVPRECSKNCFGANVCLYSYKTRQKSLELSFDLISERNKEGKK